MGQSRWGTEITSHKGSISTDDGLPPGSIIKDWNNLGISQMTTPKPTAANATQVTINKVVRKKQPTTTTVYEPPAIYAL